MIQTYKIMNGVHKVKKKESKEFLMVDKEFEPEVTSLKYKSKIPARISLKQDAFTVLVVYMLNSIDYSHIVLIIAIWPGDRIRRPEHSTVEHGSCDESV